MVDFLKLARRRSVWNELTYYTLNIGLASVLFILTQTIQSPFLAIVLVLLSKWRVLAVRPRFWWTNIQANMVDIIVGVSIVSLMYLPQLSVFMQAALAVIYALWLVVLKPKSGHKYMTAQAFAAVILGTMALYSSSHEWPVVIVVLAMYAIGYSAARHFLYSYEETQMVFLSAIWGLLLAELGWLAYYWAYGYSLPGIPALQVPQITIVATLLAFVGERIYRSSVNNKQIVVGDVVLPAVFSGLLILVIMLFFNSVVI